MARRSMVQYGCKATTSMYIKDENMGSSIAETVSGFDISGTMAFCVKRSEKENKCAVYRMNAFETATSPSNVKSIPYKSYGMTYYARNLYITTGTDKVVMVSYEPNETSTTLFSVVPKEGKAFNSTAVTAKEKNIFILMATSLNKDGFLCFSVCDLDSVNHTLTENRRFYVKNTGYTEVKDIYYDPDYGLFIVTNIKEQNGIANSNLILRVDSERCEAKGYNNCDLYYPVNRYYLSADDTAFSTFTIESVAIASKGNNIGKMYAVANVVKKDGTIVDRLIYFNNFTFNAGKPFSIVTQSYTTVNVPYITEGNITCNNAGALALNGETGYSLVSFTSKKEPVYKEHWDKASVLLHTSNVNSESFERLAPKPGAGVYTNMGHGNGMTYYDGALYIAAYIREDVKEGITATQHIVKLSTEGVLLGEYKLDKDVCIGSISHYRDNLFIAGEYNNLGRKDDKGKYTYALNPKFYIGYFENNRFITTRSFSVTNPAYSSAQLPNNDEPLNVLQDIHYDDDFGLYYVTYTNGVSHMYRISPERIEDADEGAPLAPDEQFELESSFGELESPVVSAPERKAGAMYIACNNGLSGNFVHKVTGFKFYHSDLV